MTMNKIIFLCLFSLLVSQVCSLADLPGSTTNLYLEPKSVKLLKGKNINNCNVKRAVQLYDTFYKTFQDDEKATNSFEPEVCALKATRRGLLMQFNFVVPNAAKLRRMKKMVLSVNYRGLSGNNVSRWRVKPVDGKKWTGVKTYSPSESYTVEDALVGKAADIPNLIHYDDKGKNGKIFLSLLVPNRDAALYYLDAVTLKINLSMPSRKAQTFSPVYSTKAAAPGTRIEITNMPNDANPNDFFVEFKQDGKVIGMEYLRYESDVWSFVLPYVLPSGGAPISGAKTNVKVRLVGSSKRFHLRKSATAETFEVQFPTIQASTGEVFLDCYEKVMDDILAPLGLTLGDLRTMSNPSSNEFANLFGAFNAYFDNTNNPHDLKDALSKDGEKEVLMMFLEQFKVKEHFCDLADKIPETSKKRTASLKASDEDPHKRALTLGSCPPFPVNSGAELSRYMTEAYDAKFNAVGNGNKVRSAFDPIIGTMAVLTGPLVALGATGASTAAWLGSKNAEWKYLSYPYYITWLDFMVTKKALWEDTPVGVYEEFNQVKTRFKNRGYNYAKVAAEGILQLGKVGLAGKGVRDVGLKSSQSLIYVNGENIPSDAATEAGGQLAEKLIDAASGDVPACLWPLTKFKPYPPYFEMKTKGAIRNAQNVEETFKYEKCSRGIGQMRIKTHGKGCNRCFGRQIYHSPWKRIKVKSVDLSVRPRSKKAEKNDQIPLEATLKCHSSNKNPPAIRWTVLDEPEAKLDGCCTSVKDKLETTVYAPNKDTFDFYVKAKFTGNVEWPDGCGDEKRNIQTKVRIYGKPSVTLSPGGQCLEYGETVTVNARVENASDTSVTWSKTGGGSLSNKRARSATYTAGNSNAYAYVTATSNEDPSVDDTVRFIVREKCICWFESTALKYAGAGSITTYVDYESGSVGIAYFTYAAQLLQLTLQVDSNIAIQATFQNLSPGFTGIVRPISVVLSGHHQYGMYSVDLDAEYGGMDFNFKIDSWDQNVPVVWDTSKLTGQLVQGSFSGTWLVPPQTEYEVENEIPHARASADGTFIARWMDFVNDPAPCNENFPGLNF